VARANEQTNAVHSAENIPSQAVTGPVAQSSDHAGMDDNDDNVAAHNTRTSRRARRPRINKAAMFGDTSNFRRAFEAAMSEPVHPKAFESHAGRDDGNAPERDDDGDVLMHTSKR
jgi:hypothetical protein